MTTLTTIISVTCDASRCGDKSGYYYKFANSGVTYDSDKRSFRTAGADTAGNVPPDWYAHVSV